MARAEKNNVDYFPHFVNTNDELYILERQFGNNGYAFFYKVFEMLGRNAYHYIDCRQRGKWELLLAQTLVDGNVAEEMMCLLCDLGIFDKEMWSEKIIFSESFVLNIEDVYERRKNKCLQKLDLCKHLSLKCKHKPPPCTHDVDRNTQSKVKERKEEESKVENMTPSQKAKDFFQKIEEMKLLPTDERQKFYLYWTELSKSGKKQRWEMQKTFDVGRRYGTWLANAEKFNNNYQKNDYPNSKNGRISQSGHADLRITNEDL